MFKNRTNYCLTILFLLVNAPLFSQKILLEYDSIPIVKPKLFKSNYLLNHPILKEISVVNGSPKPASELSKNGNISEGVLTLLTGLHTSSSEDVLCMTKNELAANDQAYSWEINLFFSGEFNKTRERIKNDDGSSSLSTEKGIYVDWNDGAYGIILEKNDSIGEFTVSISMQSDTLYWLSKLEAENKMVYDKLKKYRGDNPVHTDFMVEGKIHGKEFSIITSGSHFRSLIFMDRQPKAIFQHSPDFIILNKKDKVSPYVLANNSVNDIDKINLLRLSMLQQLVANTLSVDFYKQ